MNDATPLTSSNVAATTDRRIIELLVVVMMIHYSLLRKEGADDDDAREIVVGQEQQMTKILREGMTINTREQSAVSMELLMVTQRLLDEQLRLLDGGEKGRAEVSSSASDHQLMDGAAAGKKKKAAAAAKKKRNKRNKAAAKRKGGTTKPMSWLGGGIISLIMMAVLIVSLLLIIPQSDGGSSEGKAPPTLPPSTSTSLRQRDLQSSMSSTTGMSPMTADVQSPVFSPATASPSPRPRPRDSVSNRRMKSDERALSTCFDTPDWKDQYGDGCDWHRENEEPGCPQYGSLYDGGMGVASESCCYCGGGSHNLPPTTTSASPTPPPTHFVTRRPTPSPPTRRPSPRPMSPFFSRRPSGGRWALKGGRGPFPGHGHGASKGGRGASRPPTLRPSRPSMKSMKPPTSAPLYHGNHSKICTDTLGWYDKGGYDCSWYEIMDVPGCPQYGDVFTQSLKGHAIDNCCHCKNDVVSTAPSNVSPTKAPSSSLACADSPVWKDTCDVIRTRDDPGCPKYGNFKIGDIGTAAENCCYCKDPTCEDFNRKCQYYKIKQNQWTKHQHRVSSLCNKAASCLCEAADHFKIVGNDIEHSDETVGLYNECKCDFWLRLCQTRGGYACDYSAEYCCGDYRYDEDDENFRYLNSPLCYCDFFNYAENEFGHMLKPKALSINKEFSNPCGQLEDIWGSFGQSETQLTSNPRQPYYEKESLEVIYEATNGQNWTNDDGWMNKTVDHCQWYGISCDVEGHVTSIDLKDNNLVGQFPVYARNVTARNDTSSSLYVSDWEWSKYGLANLYKLKNLDLSNNKLTGTIEYGPLYNLNALTRFDVSGNQLSGELQALVAPLLMYADFSNNGFTSMRRFQKYKESFGTLRYCDISDNPIQEDATDLLENIPPNIEHFIAFNDSFNGSLPVSLNYLPKLRRFNMASNALFGKLPAFTESFATLQELDLSNQENGFTGSIPGDIWRSLSLKKLNLAGNRLTSAVPSFVGNLAVLEVFDLSNNLLEGSIPSEFGMLQGFLKRLDLSINTLSGTIPYQLGQLQGASVFLRYNLFHTKRAAPLSLPSQLGRLQGASILLKYNHFQNNTTAPLSLCLEREVKEFDLANDTTLCPIERNALSEFYHSAKGAEWTDQGSKTDGTNWLDESASYCDWKGVTCDDMKRVTKLNLTNNGLSGRLSESIGNLTFIEELDLSDNDIKGSIPTEIGLLSNLTYLRLSYNAFTGAVPEGLGEIKGLQLLQLQSNRITVMPNIQRLDNSIHGQSTFVTDCGVPSAFDEALRCENCTMCCNANDDCYPQAETQVAKWGLNYSTFAAVLFACFIVLLLWWMVVFFLYLFDKRKNSGDTSTMSMETRIKEDYKYALSKIGKESVYSYFVTDNGFGWLAALATLGIQIVILTFFIQASEANLQDEKIDIQFTWQCPRDTDACKDKADLTDAGWVIFCLLMAASLAKDFIGGFKLIYHSAKSINSLWVRFRYFFGGMCLFWVTLFALYVSTIYNKAIATSNTEIIVNSVIILFVMDLDEWIFSLLASINAKWTAHAEDDTTDEMKKEIMAEMETKIGRLKADMEKEIALLKAQIASQQQQEELRVLREIVQRTALRTSRNARAIQMHDMRIWSMGLGQKIQQESQVRREQIAAQQEEFRKLCEAVYYNSSSDCIRLRNIL